jgi:hypothetical protein
MATKLPLFDQITIDSPCPVSWESMQGDKRVRHCRHCQKNVYNLSAMTREEVVGLIQQKEVQLCGRMFRRADGTLLTSDCPVGLREVRRRIVRALFGIAATVLALVGGIAWGRKSAGILPGGASVVEEGPLTRFTNWIEPHIFPLAGDICVPSTTSSPTPPVMPQPSLNGIHSSPAVAVTDDNRKS